MSFKGPFKRANRKQHSVRKFDINTFVEVVVYTIKDKYPKLNMDELLKTYKTQNLIRRRKIPM